MSSQELSFQEKNIIFIGFMGVGKTTIGQEVAVQLDREFIDIDEKIVQEFGMPVPEIFHEYGEKAFRAKEKEIALFHVEQQKKVISMGGGAFMQEEIRDACMKQSVIVFLEMSWDSWKERIPSLIDTRPVLQNLSMEGIEELFYKRQDLYTTNHYRINTDDQDVGEIAERIIDSLQRDGEINTQDEPFS